MSFSPQNLLRVMENNWLQTIPGKSFIVILRVYGPLKPWIDKTWRPGEVMLVKIRTSYFKNNYIFY
jgi:hypothetical protein